MLRDLLIYISAYIGLFAVTFYTLSLIERAKEIHPEFPEKNPPFVSILIPAWNEAKGITNSIKSALKIDYPKNKLEIIIVDDGSIDDTYKIACKLKSKVVRVFRHLKNKGKGAALNLALSKAKGEIVVTMDADNTYVEKDALKHMVAYFANPRVMCVAPIIAIYKPKGILQRIQQIEFLLGVFLRKAFASAEAIHITPGAFSAYRKSFFNKYGGFALNNLTEDLEAALRIQTHNYIIENSLNAKVYAFAPNKFKTALIQRKRWYIGLLRNLWSYKHLFSKDYGSLGLIVLPTALLSVFASVVLTGYLIIYNLIKLRAELLLWKSVNFNVLSSMEFNKLVIERYFFLIFSNPIFLLLIVFLGILAFYMVYAKKYVKKHSNIKLSLIWFVLFYSFFFAFWWIVSFFYTLFNKKVSWR
jgi:cellulose synthase/poly-beta-1,6-N-acetylglucosamine synthase-like glycosyltransferase